LEDPHVPNRLEPPNESAGEEGIALDREDAPGAPRDLGREDPSAGADLDDQIARGGAGAPDDLSCGATPEEVLPGRSRAPMTWPLPGHGR
jgi:hypothetical protein